MSRGTAGFGMLMRVEVGFLLARRAGSGLSRSGLVVQGAFGKAGAVGRGLARRHEIRLGRQGLVAASRMSLGRERRGLAGVALIGLFTVGHGRHRWVGTGVIRPRMFRSGLAR